MRHPLHLGVLLAALAVGACADQSDSPLAPQLAPNGPDRMVVFTPGPYAQVEAGTVNTCAATTGGVAVCWGRDVLGESSPPLWLRGVTQVSAGGDGIGCALAAGGAAVCWGSSFSVSSSDVPAALKSGAVQVESAITYNCGVTGAGEVLCWDRGPKSVPAEVQSGVTRVSLSQYQACALKGGRAICWVTNAPAPLLYPVPTVAQSGLAQMAVGDNDFCGLTDAGSVVCWDKSGSVVPIVPPAAQSGVKQITAGPYHYCALTQAGGVVCWASEFGLGGDLGQTTVPAAAQSGIKQVSAGGFHTCAVTNAGAILCWGSNYIGESDPPPIAGQTRHVLPTATFGAPWNAIVGQRVPVTFTDVQVPGIPTATSFTYAYDCGTGTFGAASTSSTGTCVFSAVGEVEVRGKVIDRDGDYSTYSAYLYVISQADAATQLYWSVAGTYWIDPTVLAGLTDKLVAMQQSLAAGKPATACNQLDAFLSQVRAQRGKAIDAPTADWWIRQANDLRSALGC